MTEKTRFTFASKKYLYDSLSKNLSNTLIKEEAFNNIKEWLNKNSPEELVINLALYNHLLLFEDRNGENSKNLINNLLNEHIDFLNTFKGNKKEFDVCQKYMILTNFYRFINLWIKSQ